MSRPELSTRQAQVTALVAIGKPNKEIAAHTGLSVRTVEDYIQAAAARIVNERNASRKPRERLTLWFFGIEPDSDGLIP
jgi:FixJ family two-component response regulator